MLFDQLSAVKALGNLISLGVLGNPTTHTQVSVAGSAKSTVNPELSSICGDIISESNDGVTLFWASDVYDCLSNVPFNIGPALRYLDYFNTTIQFHSTLAFLRSPPEGYQQPAVDVETVLERIVANVKTGSYGNQYDFEADVQRVAFAMHDAHVDLRSGVMSRFSFGSQDAITSVSVDGIEPPKVYLTDDILEAQSAGWRWTPSPITHINGEDVVDYLTKFAAENSLGRLEGHAEWNDLMSHPAQDIMGNLNIWTGDATFYPGDGLNFTRENDADPIETYFVSYYNYGEDTGPIANGGDFYNFFVLGIYPATNESAAYRVGESQVAKRSFKNIKRQDGGDGDDPASSSDANPNWYSDSYGAYPEVADIHQTDLSVTGSGVITGYFFHDISAGVLSIPSFDQYGIDLYDFSDTVQNFIDSAVTNDIKHVVIDLQQNSGGDVVLAFDTFSRFFPAKQPFAGSRRRGHEMGRVLGNATTTWWSRLDPQNDDEIDDWYEGIADEWVITPRLNAETKKNYRNWAEYAGPVPSRGDWFTKVEEYNLNDEDFNYEAMDMSPYGYADNPSTTNQQWDPKDIVILTDGLCSSACAMFVEFMTRMGVRTVVMGGKPTTGPMQAASGTRGARGYWSGDLDNDLAWAGLIDETANRTFPPIPLSGYYRDSGIWTTYIGLNLRDQIREDEMKDDNAVPLQFKYEAADCRLFYTLHNIYNMTQQWRDVAAAAWDPNVTMCVEGSTGYSTTGQNKPKEKPPTDTKEIDYNSIQGDGWTSPAGSDVLSTLEFKSGNLADSPFQPPEYLTLQECKIGADGQPFCPNSKKPCVTVDIACKSSKINKKTGKRPTHPVSVCLPTCVDNAGCGDWDPAYSMYCDTYQKTETKASSVLKGKDGKQAENKQFKETKKGYSKVCKPKFGTKSIGSCPAQTTT